MFTFVLVIVIGGQAMATNCEDGALCFETYDKCSLFAQRLNNRPDLDIQAYCERQSIYKFKYAPIKL